VLPKQCQQADGTKLLFRLRLVTDRRGGVEQSAFTRLGSNSDLLPANEAAMDTAIVVPLQPVDVPATVESANAESATEVARMLPQLSLEIRAALDTSLRKELADLRGFLGTALDGHAERLQGDLATLLPPSRSPGLDMPTMIAERRPWAAILGWSFALLATGCAAFTTWLWWNQGGEIAALRTDLAAAYAEAETLRARPVVVSVPAPDVLLAPVPEALSAEGAVAEPVAGSLIAADAASVATAPASVAAVSAAPVSAAPVSAAPGGAAPEAAAPATTQPAQAQ